MGVWYVTAHPEPLLCDNLEGQRGEWGRGHTNAYGRFMLRYGKHHHNIKNSNQQIIEEMEKEIKICIEMNENENTQPKTYGTL